MMNNYPHNFEQKIEFDKVKKLIQKQCMGAYAKELIEELAPYDQLPPIEKQTALVSEFVKICQMETDAFPLDGYYDTRVYLKRIKTEGSFLQEDELFELYRSLLTIKRLVNFFSVQDPTEFPYLIAESKEIAYFPELERQIDAILDKFGRIKDNASVTLFNIRKQAQQLNSSISRIMATIIKKAQQDGYMEKDVAPAMRDGRLVLPISPAFKRKLGGIVHDESATGKTVYVEPAAVVETNNQIRELEAEERREIIKILTQCADCIRPYISEMEHSYYYLALIDSIRAKALFALQIKGIRPHFVAHPHMDWQNATHPLLYLSLQEQGKEIVPLDIRLNEQARILLISGPNAGGKSVCLKTVGLLQYMAQCGLLVPMREESTMGLFANIFIDIGDEQSLENDLSTYSSHLRNMKHFLRHGGGKSLLLIDEFGSGTEPQIGGAIAQAELGQFNHKHCYGVINTHYTNLKHFASQTEGLVNGAMLYDRHEMKPLFQLSIGNPGSSFAVEIARQIGLPEEVIQQAADIVGEQHLDYDKNLQDIVRDKRYWENKRQQVKIKEKKMNERDRVLQEQLDTIEKQRKAIIREAKEEAKQMIAEANASIEKTIREIKEAKAEKERTKAIRKELEQAKNKLTKEDDSRKTPIIKRPKKKQPVNKDTLAVGDAVQYGDNVGEIIQLEGEKAIIALGTFKVHAKVSELTKANRKQVRTQEQRMQYTPTQDLVREHQLKFKTKIDVRGLRTDEALQQIIYYIDDAIMMGVSTVRILHGTGTGALKETIREYLHTVPEVRSAKDELIQLGGAGITVVEFKD